MANAEPRVLGALLRQYRVAAGLTQDGLAWCPIVPSPGSPYADFGGGPNLFTAGSKQFVGDGTKAGTYWALDPSAGNIVWQRTLLPGGTFGGFEWGSSVADGRGYVASANSPNTQITLTKPAPGSPTQTSGGFWAALDAATGKILWEQADPAGPTFGAMGQTATANCLVFAGSSDRIIRLTAITALGVQHACRKRFSHAFFRQTLDDESVAPHRIHVHQQVASAL